MLAFVHVEFTQGPLIPMLIVYHFPIKKKHLLHCLISEATCPNTIIVWKVLTSPSIGNGRPSYILVYFDGKYLLKYNYSVNGLI